MKIVLLSFLFEPELGGGAAVVVNQLSRLLVEHSHSVTVVTTWKGSHIKVEQVDGIKLIRIPALNLYWVAEKDRQATPKKIVWQLIDLWNPLVYRMVRQILIEEAADIVHSHKLRGLSPSIWSAAVSAGVKKIVHTCHDYELLSPEGFFMGWAGKLAREQNIVMRPYQILRRRYSRFVQEVTAPSQFVLDRHLEMGFFSRAKTGLISNTHGFGLKEIQLNREKFSKTRRENPVKKFLYLGRLDKAKGVDLLFQAFSRIAGQGQGCLLRVTGWGPLEEALREKYKHQDNIVFTGPVFGPEKYKLIRESDMLVAPSLSPEPFGIVIVEAYAYGVPVITSRAGAFPELVRDGETGFLVDTGSVDDLSTVLAKVSQKPVVTKAMSENCFVEAEKYTVEKFLDGYLHIYEDNIQ